MPWRIIFIYFLVAMLAGPVAGAQETAAPEPLPAATAPEALAEPAAQPVPAAPASPEPPKALPNPAKLPAAAAAEVGQSIKETRPNLDVSITFGKIFWSLVLLVFAYLAIRFLSRLLEALSEKWAAQRLAIKSAIPIIRILAWVFTAYVVIEGVIAPPFESLLALGASAGLALGFASQDVLKNVFGGILILIDRPFQVGDKIEADKYYGEVVHIGLRTVRVVTADDSLVSIPNSVIVNQSVLNSNSGEPNCQVVAEVFLPFGVDFGLVKSLAHQAAVTSQYVYLGKPVAVILKNEIHQGVSIIKVRIKAYVHDLRHEHAFASEMTEIFIDQLRRSGQLPAAWAGQEPR
ncbi:MAG: mechanosensitive ion channel family protein [bacterium]|nr:mechanosensitive ion channel family protein [bacterium]